MKCICGRGANEEIEDLKFKLILALQAKSWRDREIDRLNRALSFSSRVLRVAKSQRDLE